MPDSSVILGRLEEPWEVKDLPKFPGWAAMFGPGLVWAGLSQGSGELIWWPYIVAKYGTYFLGWLFFFAFLQYWINLEIARYTMATGESIYEEFHRLHHLYGWLMFILVFIVSFWIAGYISGGIEALVYAAGNWPFPGNHELATRFWATIGIWIVLIIFLLGPVAYKIVEIVEAVAALASFFGMLIAAVSIPAVAKVAGTYFASLFTPHLPLVGFTWHDPNPITPRTVTWDPADAAVLVTMICYTGAGGFWNLYYSFWVRDKNAAMSALIGRVTSPLTGEPEAIPAIGYGFSEKDLTEWDMWIKWLWVDNAFGVIFNLITIILTTILTYAVLFPQGLVPGTGFKLLKWQAEWFGTIWGGVGRIALWILAFFFLTDTYITGLDGIARTTASNLFVNIPEVKERIDYSKLYYIIVGLFTIIATIEVWIQKPGALLILTGVGNLLIMCIYATVFLYSHWFWLPKVHPAGKAIRPSWISFIFLLIAAVFFWYAFLGIYVPVKILKIS